MHPAQEYDSAIQKLSYLDIDGYGMKAFLSLPNAGETHISAQAIHPMMICYISVHQGISAQ
jgi:hypothetical protein